MAKTKKNPVAVKCQKCGAERVLCVPYIKVCDSFNVHIDGYEDVCQYEGYMEENYGINSWRKEDGSIEINDDMSFSYCLECGQIQGEFPVKKLKIEIKTEEVLAVGVPKKTVWFRGDDDESDDDDDED